MPVSVPTAIRKGTSLVGVSSASVLGPYCNRARNNNNVMRISHGHSQHAIQSRATGVEVQFDAQRNPCSMHHAAKPMYVIGLIGHKCDQVRFCA